MLIRICALAAVAGLFPVMTVAQEQEMITLAGSALTEGAAPDGCRASLTGGGSPSVWKVSDKTSSAHGKAVIQTSRESIDARYPLCIVDSAKATDVEIGVDITPLEGSIDQAGGLIFRALDENNYYIVRANALENNVDLFRTVNGVRRRFAGGNASVASGKPQRLGVRMEGDLIKVFFQKKQLFEARDQTFKGRGAVGLWTKADSVTAFANMTFQNLKE